jgi:protein-L-isoaspartate O-methyltransferase
MISLDDLLSHDLIPDPAIRIGIRNLLGKKLREETRPDAVAQSEALSAFVAELRASPIAIKTAAANEQHYEVPTEFFRYVLGPRMKYSSGYWPNENTTFAESEDAMLALTCSRAALADGQDILELGCGWGSLTLWMAEKFPQSRITGVSNSSTQKTHIESEAARRGLRNVSIRTADMNEFEAGDNTFDRVVSVEMFEHMKNYELLLKKIAHPASKVIPLDVRIANVQNPYLLGFARDQGIQATEKRNQLFFSFNGIGRKIDERVLCRIKGRRLRNAVAWRRCNTLSNLLRQTYFWAFDPGRTAC